MSRVAVLIEDGAGGLHVLLQDDSGRYTAAASGLEGAEGGALLRDMAGAVQDGISGWSGVLPPEEAAALAKQFNSVLLRGLGGAGRVVAEADRHGVEVYTDRMGLAARRYAGMAREV